jgi:hypothetical protein
MLTAAALYTGVKQKLSFKCLTTSHTMETTPSFKNGLGDPF